MQNIKISYIVARYINVFERLILRFPYADFVGSNDSDHQVCRQPKKLPSPGDVRSILVSISYSNLNKNSC